MKTRGWEESNQPDLLSTPYSDKSHRAAALDDRLSRCTEPSPMQPAKSKVLWRKCSSTPHIMAHKYSWERWRPQQATVWCEKAEKVHLELISLSLSTSRGGRTDITVLVRWDRVSSHLSVRLFYEARTDSAAFHSLAHPHLGQKERRWRWV